MDATTNTAATFAPGQLINAKSAASYDTVWTFEVVKRTAKFVTLRDLHGETRRCGVKLDQDGNEYVLPFGDYSMRPMARAEYATN